MASKQLAGDGSLIWQDDPDPVRPLSGHGASRQTRRMQLRNAGFRGPTMPGRKVSPTSLSSGNWSNVSGGHLQSSDAENHSPSGARATLNSVGKRAGSGVLTEIGNSTLTRSKKYAHVRPRVTSAKFYSNVEGRKTGEYDAAFPMEQSSPQPNHLPVPAKNGFKPRSTKVKGKLGAKRRSVSGETKHYIDHLEAELASAQTQLSAVTSPSVTRQQSSMMRSLNTETRQLQEALEEWEDRYDERVQEVVDQYSAIEVSLRSQIRSFEEQREEDQYRIHELEQQVENMNQNMESAEAANVHLERRLEILSDLLATSAKIDLHAETPGMSRRMSRPKSMHPRFPTTGNLMISPERLSEVSTQPPSPALSFASSTYSHLDLRQTRSNQEFISGHVPQSEHFTDSESVFSDAPYMNESLTTAEPSLPVQHTQYDMRPPSIPPRGRPTRRMRRFGAGSNGPRPLILPSASHYDHVPASAPAFDFHEASPGFPFRNRSMSRNNGSPLEGRRRASTMMDRATWTRLTGSAMLAVPRAEQGDQSILSSNSPVSGNSQVASTTKDFSSLGSCAGAAVSRNLMEELSQIRSFDGTEGSNEEDCESVSEDQDLDDTELQESFSEVLEPIPESHSREVSETTTSTATVMGLQPCTSTASSTRSDSLIDRLRRLFSNLWHSPVQLARHLLQNAQSRMRLPAPLRNVQWWLVSVLLGPMAKRRLLSTHRSHNSCSNSRIGEHQDDRQRLLISPENTRSTSEPSSISSSECEQEEEDEDLAYGTFRPTTPNATSHTSPKNNNKPSSPRPSMAGPGKKRAKNSDGSLVVRTSSFSSSSSPKHRQERAKQQRDQRQRQRQAGFTRHSLWLWLKFSITLAFAIGCAFKSGPGSLLAGADGGDGEGADGRDGDGEDCGVCVGCKTNKRMMKRERERMIESGENESSGARRDQRLIEPA
jgi:hypothetical protein